MEGGGALTIIAVLLLAPFQAAGEASKRWKMLDPIEQNLRRAGQGFALLVALLVMPFALFRAHEVGGYIVQLATDPTRRWSLALLYLCAFWFGALRCIVGVHRLAGIRDSIRASSAIVKLVIATLIAAYLKTTWPWGQWQFATSVWGYAALMLLLAVACGNALTALMRVVLLTGGGGSAQRLIEKFLKRKHAPMRPARWRWWQRR